MPTYEYVCDACRHEFEQYQSIKDDPLTKCPKCSKKKLRRKIGIGGGFIFKGSGFYVTDYRSQSYKDAAKKDVEAPAAKPAESSSGKPEKTSPATAAPATPATGDSAPAAGGTSSEKPGKRSKKR